MACHIVFCCAKRLSESSGLTLGLHEAENVVLADGALDVTDDGTGGVVDELNTDLSHTSSGAGSSKNLDDLSKLDGSLSILVSQLFRPERFAQTLTIL